MPELCLFDVHSHFLPGIDDGCKSVEESLSILRAGREQGVRLIAATPHYYSRISVEAFLEKRQRAYETVSAAMSAGEVWPEIRLGAEVAYHAGLVYEERLRELCYEGTNYLLLEMPFGTWTPNILRDVENLRSLYGVVPVIAHLERYLNRRNRSMVERLMELDLPIQINAGFVLNCRPSFKLRHMLRSGWVDLLGSDCHSPDSRPQNLGAARSKLLSWGMEEELEEICANSARLFGLSANHFKDHIKDCR